MNNVLDVVDNFLLPMFQAGQEKAMQAGLSPETFAKLNERFAAPPIEPGVSAPVDMSAVAPVPMEAPTIAAPPAPPVDPLAITDEDLMALSTVESGGIADPTMAVSEAGAQGKYQMLPATAMETAAKLGIDPATVDPRNEGQQKMLAKAYLQELTNQFGSKELGIRAYHAGPGNVQQAIEATGSNDPAAIDRFFAQNNMPRSAAYGSKVQSAYGKPNTPEGELSDAFDAQKVGHLEQMAVLDKQNKLLGQQSDLLNQSYQAELENAELERQAAEKRIAEVGADLDKAKLDFESGKIDQNRIFSNMGTGQKVGMIIAAALSGFAAGFSGKEDMFMKYLDQAINNDIEAQKIDIGVKRDIYDKKSHLYEQLLEKWGNPEIARAGTRIMGLQYAQKQLEIAAQATSNQEKKAIAAQKIAQLSQEQIKEDVALKNAAANTPETVQTWAQKINQVQGKKGAAMELAGMPKSLKETYVPGIGFTRSEKEASEVSADQANVKSINRTLDRMIEFRKNSTIWDKLDPSQVAPLVSDLRQSLLNLKDRYGLGALQRFEMQLIGEVLPQDISSFELATKFLKFARIAKNSDRVIETYKGLKDRVNQDFYNSMETRVPLRFDAFEQEKANVMKGIGDKTMKIPTTPASELSKVNGRTN